METLGGLQLTFGVLNVIFYDKVNVKKKKKILNILNIRVDNKGVEVD